MYSLNIYCLVYPRHSECVWFKSNTHPQYSENQETFQILTINKGMVTAIVNMISWILFQALMKTDNGEAHGTEDTATYLPPLK